MPWYYKQALGEALKRDYSNLPSLHPYPTESIMALTSPQTLTVILQSLLLFP